MPAPFLPEPGRRRLRRPTATASFGSSRRESHDASGFYERFVEPQLSDDSTIARPEKLDVIHLGDARHMEEVESCSVALVVTSPPYFAGKEYEESLGRGGVPGTYFEYLDLLRDVFCECRRTLEPGGRMAVNVANLGRRPYRSLAGDVADILQDLGLLLRGEIVWWKGRAAGGSCAWGSFRQPANPVLRDVTERIVIASKGRFDRALRPARRLELGLPSSATISRDEFLEATTDIWEIPPESATRVGHPAPFPVELPERLIELYTYADDVVLDPFVGSGSSAVAAVRTDRRFIGYDTSPEYAEQANRRMGEEMALRPRRQGAQSPGGGLQLPGVAATDEAGGEVERAVREGRGVKELAGVVLDTCGFVDIRSEVRVRGLELSFAGRDQLGHEWAFDVSGGLTAIPTGLRRADTLWRAIGRAAVHHQDQASRPLVLLTTDMPRRSSPGHVALDAVQGPDRPVFDVVQLLDAGDRARLREHALGGWGHAPRGSGHDPRPVVRVTETQAALGR